ncbi:MAG: anti-sigma factor [Micrococcales bacterium]|nr:anti-sigma factor [Micrococcales bacterium]
MAHLDDDTIALLALGEPADAHAAEHLAECPDCAREVGSLAEAARVGRETVSTERLARPEPRVWAAIAAEIGIDTEPTMRRVADADAVPRRPGRGRSLVLAAVSIAAAAAIVVTGLVLLVPRPTAPPVREAAAALRAFPNWPGAEGTAVLERQASGDRILRIRLTRVSVPSGDVAELWLMDVSASKLVSLGDLSGSSGEFAVPDGVDLAAYSTVDVSAEPPDGDPAHSGDSIVRGSLRPPKR